MIYHGISINRELHSYSDQIEPTTFVLSDVDKINGKQQLDIVEGDKKALVVKFTLGSAQYATMVLREIMKTETSSSFQANLSLVYNNDLE